METLKMFVWKDVLCDYTCGMICILAHNVEEAIVIARKELESYEFREVSDDPEVYDSPALVYVWGGG